MNEIEIKIIEINKEKVIKKLFEVGAKKIDEYEIFALFFDDMNKTFSSKKELIRLRKKNNSAFITFKGKEENDFARTSEEIEFEVSDFKKAQMFLEKIGLISRETKRKHRTSFKLKNSLIEIDEYEEIPIFLEIESPSEEEIKEIIDLLELNKENIRTWNGFDLFKHYGKNIEN